MNKFLVQARGANFISTEELLKILKLKNPNPNKILMDKKLYIFICGGWKSAIEILEKEQIVTDDFEVAEISLGDTGCKKGIRFMDFLIEAEKQGFEKMTLEEGLNALRFYKGKIVEGDYVMSATKEIIKDDSRGKYMILLENGVIGGYSFGIRPTAAVRYVVVDIKDLTIDNGEKFLFKIKS